MFGPDSVDRDDAFCSERRAQTYIYHAFDFLSYTKRHSRVSSYGIPYDIIPYAVSTAIQILRCLAAEPLRPLSSVHGSRSPVLQG